MMMTDLQQTYDDALEEEEESDEEEEDGEGGGMTPAYSVDDLMGALDNEDDSNVSAPQNDSQKRCTLTCDKDQTTSLAERIIKDDVIRSKDNDVTLSERNLKVAANCSSAANVHQLVDASLLGKILIVGEGTDSNKSVDLRQFGLRAINDIQKKESPTDIITTNGLDSGVVEDIEGEYDEVDAGICASRKQTPVSNGK